MTFAENLVARLGPALAAPLYAAWRRRQGKTPANSRSLKELIAIDQQNKIAVQKLEREIQW
jgi:hypothetical protein